MTLSSLRSTSSVPFTWRAPLLAAVFFAYLLLNADYARGQNTSDPPPDDHSDNPIFATLVPFGGSVQGRIAPAFDVDFFYFDISDQTDPVDVWIYTTGEFDSLGGLFDSNVDLLFVNDDSHVEGRARNFHIRAILEPGLYFVLVRSYRGLFSGDYTLHIEPVPDHGDTAETATQLGLFSPVAARLDTRSEDHYFKLDVAEQSSLLISARNPLRINADDDFEAFSPLDHVLTDAEGMEIDVNVSPLGFTVDDEFSPYGFRIEDDFAPGTYFLKVTTPADRYDTTYPVFYTVNAIVDVAYTDFIEGCGAMTEALGDPSIEDPLYACQWHLDQPSGEDINVKPVWDVGLMGEGINISVVDDGLDWTHEDLIDNVDASLNYDFSDDVGIHHPFNHHGTNVAGVIAARANDIGVRGVAPMATIHSHNLLHGLATSFGGVLISDVDEAAAMARNADVTAVSNNSWGPASGAAPGGASALWELAVENGINSGYGGRGVLYVFSAGNGHRGGADANLNELGNFYAVTGVCAVNEGGTRSFYSEMGSNLWVCAPSNHPRTEEMYRSIVTTENSDRYADYFGGTSSAAPTVSGVAALVRQANPGLTWRDVKLVLADSARMNDPDNPGWEVGALTYGAASDSDRYSFNHEYGFGVVDAAAAVDLARAWINLPPMQEASISSSKIDRLIPDAYDAPSIETVTLTLDIDSDIDFTEFVEINTSFQHNSFRDLDIELESPSGAISKLVPAFNTFTDDDDPDNDYIPLRDPFRFGSARHLGEDPNGTWKLHVTDRLRFGFGNIESWGITVYGHSSTELENIAPVFSGGESISRTVAENSPAGDPVGDPVTASDFDTLEYTIGGPDAALFNVDGITGQIAVGTGTSLDYEMHNAYTVTVTATDPSGEAAMITVNIAVTDVTLGEVGDRYDANHNERIDAGEVLQAVADYFAGLLTSDEALEIVALFFSG